MATAGAVIASAEVEEEGTSPPVETTVDVLPQPIADVVQHQRALAAIMVAPMPQAHIAARPMVHPTPRQGMPAHHTPAVADRTVAASIASHSC
jgi:hypothetical protein